ncbi:flavodoxin domain-containing protein [Nocardioides sp. MAHUQ-72]|uniref:flavodoxin domain-containing protein n=1 Tax=unclassified Nocardioides TaxID=2615069 RepID=UPI00361325F2
MTVLVVYGSRYGATQGIAERIAETLRACGQQVDVEEGSEFIDAKRYDAFVIGSAAYQGSWLEGPVEFVMHHVDLLAERPVWLFSSGPLGRPDSEADRRGQLEVTRPRQFAEMEEALAPRGAQVFYGALQPEKLRRFDRLVRRVPRGRQLLPAGDFRDWTAVDEWARQIAAELPRSVQPEGST